MSLQWTLVAGFLYVEIAVVLLLILPFISAKRWSSLFKSRFAKAVAAHSQYYFIILIGILVLLFLESIREMAKYTKEQSDMDHVHLGAEMQVHMKLFRAQRNFYIAGFALFLCLVLKRLASLIMSQAILEAEKKAAMNQAESATRTAQSLLDRDENEGANQNNTVAELNDQVKELKDKLTEAEEKLRVAVKDKEAMSSQAKSVMNEYDRLMKEHEELQRELQEGDKKDD